MKKFILITTGVLTLVQSAQAQKSKVRTAEEYLQEENYKKAIPVIDEAVANEDTKANARAWYIRGRAYLSKALDTAAKSPDAGDIATASFMKALELDPNYDPEQIKNPLYSTAILAFNRGVAAYSAKDYTGAYTSFGKVSQIYNVKGGKMYAADKSFTELVQNAKSNSAYSALNNQQYDLAAPILEDIRSQKGASDSNVYQSLVEIYLKQSNDAKLLTTLNDARKQFPNSEYFRNQELNYYIKSGKSGELMTKLEEAVAKDPNNPELLFNLANAYEKVAYPTDVKDGAMAASTQAIEAYDKADKAYQKLLSINSANADYNYNAAVLYYSRAGAVNKQMMAMKGSSPAETKQWDALMVERNKYFDMALPYFEKSYSVLDPNAANLTEGEKVTYRNSITGMREIYSRKNNKAKTDELSKKLSALK